MPDTKPKPDLRDWRPDLREMLIKRRNYWRAKRGQPIETWDSVTESLIDRDDLIVREAVARTVAALGHADSEPDAAVAVGAMTPPATASAPAAPLHELTIDDFRAEAARTFDGLFDRDRSAPSPFFR